MPSQAEERAKFLVKKMNHLGDAGTNTVSMGTTDVTVNSLTSEGATVSQGVLSATTLLQSPACGGAALTAMTAIELAVNTRYASRAAATAMTLPAAADGSIGDWITVFYTIATTGAAAHTYTTTTDTAYTLGSTCQRVGGGVGSTGTESGAGENILTITGHAAGDGGIGTVVRFVNTTGALNGWAVEAITYNQGAGGTAGTIAFS